MIDFFGVKIGDTVADVYAIFAPAGRGSHTTVELYVDRRGGRYICGVVCGGGRAKEGGMLWQENS